MTTATLDICRDISFFVLEKFQAPQGLKLRSYPSLSHFSPATHVWSMTLETGIIPTSIGRGETLISLMTIYIYISLSVALRRIYAFSAPAPKPILAFGSKPSKWFRQAAANTRRSCRGTIWQCRRASASFSSSYCEKNRSRCMQGVFKKNNYVFRSVSFLIFFMYFTQRQSSTRQNTGVSNTLKEYQKWSQIDTKWRLTPRMFPRLGCGYGSRQKSAEPAGGLAERLIYINMFFTFHLVYYTV